MVCNVCENRAFIHTECRAGSLPREERIASLFPILLLAVAIPPHASAGKQTGGKQTAKLSVTATITDRCTISTAPSTFGEANPIGAHVPVELPGSGTITTACTTGASPVVTLGKGWNADGGSTDAPQVRQLMKGSNKTVYALYRDSTHSTQWGSTPGKGPSPIAGTGTAQSTTVYYGRVARGQIPRSGSYADTVVVTVSFWRPVGCFVCRRTVGAAAQSMWPG